MPNLSHEIESNSPVDLLKQIRNAVTEIHDAVKIDIAQFNPMDSYCAGIAGVAGDALDTEANWEVPWLRVGVSPWQHASDADFQGECAWFADVAIDEFSKEKYPCQDALADKNTTKSVQAGAFPQSRQKIEYFALLPRKSREDIATKIKCLAASLPPNQAFRGRLIALGRAVVASASETLSGDSPAVTPLVLDLIRDLDIAMEDLTLAEITPNRKDKQTRNRAWLPLALSLLQGDPHTHRSKSRGTCRKESFDSQPRQAIPILC